MYSAKLEGPLEVSRAPALHLLWMYACETEDHEVTGP